MKRRPWHPAEEAMVQQLYPHVATKIIAAMIERPLDSVYRRAHQLGVEKTPEYLASPAAYRLRRGHGAGVAHRFPKGHVPANKGLRRPGWHRGRMKETQFKKGQLSGQAARHVMPLGATRLVDGYVYIKVAAVQNVAYTVNWLPLHVLTWERANGPVPKGCAVRFVNGDRADGRLENLELVSRRDLMKRNSIHNLPKPLAQVAQLRGALIRQINRRLRREQD